MSMELSMKDRILMMLEPIKKNYHDSNHSYHKPNIFDNLVSF